MFSRYRNPENFIDLLKESNLSISEKIFFRHYNFSKSELSSIIFKAKKNNFCIVIEKDYFRIKDYNLRNRIS